MNARISRLPVLLALAIALQLLSCSGEDKGAEAAAPNPAETALTGAPEAAAESRSASADARLELARAYEQRCTAGQQTRECLLLHSLLVSELSIAFDLIQRSRDQRGTAKAIAALDLADEPEILVAAMRVLGGFPDTPGIAEKVTPLLLDSPYLGVQQMAAELLSRVPDPELAAMASLWIQNHAAIRTEDPYAELADIPEHYFGMGFPEYPGAEWFTPADSDRSVGWVSDDPPEMVSERLSGTLGVAAMDLGAWIERSQLQFNQVMQSMDQSSMAEVQRLTEEYFRTQDPKFLEKAQRMQEELYAPMQKAADDANLSVSEVSMQRAGSNSAQAHFRYLVAEEREGRVSRLIVVYPEPAIHRTVIQMVWDLQDYPDAWAGNTGSE